MELSKGCTIVQATLYNINPSRGWVISEKSRETFFSFNPSHKNPLISYCKY